MREAFAGNFRVEILDRGHDALDAGSDQSVGAGRGAAIMCVRFEGDVSGRTAGFLTRLVQGDGLSVLDGFEEVVAFTNNFTRRTYDDTTNQWSRTDLPGAARRQLERTGHHATIRVGPNC